MLNLSTLKKTGGHKMKVDEKRFNPKWRKELFTVRAVVEHPATVGDFS